MATILPRTHRSCRSVPRPACLHPHRQPLLALAVIVGESRRDASQKSAPLSPLYRPSLTQTTSRSQLTATASPTPRPNPALTPRTFASSPRRVLGNSYAPDIHAKSSSLRQFHGSRRYAHILSDPQDAPALTGEEAAAIEFLHTSFRPSTHRWAALYAVPDEDVDRPSTPLQGAGLKSPLNNLPSTFKEFLSLLRQDDVRSALVFAQHHGIFLDQDAWLDMSASAFSTILRCLDPILIGPQVDPAHDVPIPPSAQQHFAFTDVTAPSGTRKIYLLLARIVQKIFASRIAAAKLPSDHDWQVLMRLCGTLSNPRASARLWAAFAVIRRSAGLDVRNADNYAELIRSRFPIDLINTHFHIAKMRVSIAGIAHMEGVKLSMRARRALVGLRINRAIMVLRQDDDTKLREVLGLDQAMSAYTGEWFGDFFKVISSRNIAVNEDLACASIGAFAQQGRLKMVRSILRSIWEISVTFDKETGAIAVEGGRQFEEGDPLKPTERLLVASVRAFSCSAQMQAAFKVADHISRTYHIPIPPSLWSEMLSWTQMASTTYVQKEWALAGFPGHLVHPASIDMIWAAMTGEPYKVEPSFFDYNVLIKSLIARRGAHLSKALGYMREARSFYDNWNREVDEAELAYSLALCARTNTGQQAVKFERAVLMRSLVHSTISSWISKLCTNLRSSRDDDFLTVRDLPAFLGEFEQFQPLPIEYKTCNGHVSLVNSWNSRIYDRSAWKKKKRVSSQAARALLKWRIPDNIHSKLWYRDLLKLQARLSHGIENPAPALGDGRLGLGRPGVKRGKGRGGKAVELHYNKPSNKWHVPSKMMRAPVGRLFPGPARGLGSVLAEKRWRDCLIEVYGNTWGETSEWGHGDVERYLILRAARSEGIAAERQSRERGPSKWADQGIVKQLDPGISDDAGWEYGLQEWPRERERAKVRIREAKKVKSFVDRKRMSWGHRRKYPLRREMGAQGSYDGQDGVQD